MDIKKSVEEIETVRMQGVDCPYCEDGTTHKHVRHTPSFPAQWDGELPAMDVSEGESQEAAAIYSDPEKVSSLWMIVECKERLCRERQLRVTLKELAAARERISELESAL